jgi:hypothetical protein
MTVDLSLIDNDAFNFVSGCYLGTDVNLDGTVDASDAAITDNNAANFIGVATPCTEPAAPVAGPSFRSESSSTVNTEMKAAE